MSIFPAHAHAPPSFATAPFPSQRLPEYPAVSQVSSMSSYCLTAVRRRRCCTTAAHSSPPSSLLLAAPPGNRQTRSGPPFLLLAPPLSFTSYIFPLTRSAFAHLSPAPAQPKKERRKGWASPPRRRRRLVPLCAYVHAPPPPLLLPFFGGRAVSLCARPPPLPPSPPRVPSPSAQPSPAQPSPAHALVLRQRRLRRMKDGGEEGWRGMGGARGAWEKLETESDGEAGPRETSRVRERRRRAERRRYVSPLRLITTPLRTANARHSDSRRSAMIGEPANSTRHMPP